MNATLTRPTDVVLAGRGPLKLRPADHVATGGEGAVYRVGNDVIKLYLDPQAFRTSGLADKLAALATLRHPYVVGPRGLVNDTHGQPLGYYMPWANGEPMARVFTSDWQGRHSFATQHSSTLAARMQEVVQFAHANGAVMADANELNWLVVLRGKRGPEPRVLDVDSWAVGRWPARVVMPSVRDYHAAGFTPASDWFAWGIVTFQLYTGIHPYKGRLDGYKPGDLERRMRDNASVFSRGVRLNHAVRDFGAIPGQLLDWYRAEFEDGRREVPPSPLATGAINRTATTMARVVVTAAASLRYDRLYDGQTRPAKQVFVCGLVLLADNRLYDLASHQYFAGSWPSDVQVVRVQNGWLAAWTSNGAVQACYLPQGGTAAQNVTIQLEASALVRFRNRLFASTARGLTELQFMMLGRPLVTPGQTWGTLPHATEWFDGLGVMNALGATYLVLPFGDDACAQVRVPELDGVRVVSGQAGTRYAELVTLNKRGIYQRLELTFDRHYSSYQIASHHADGPDLNTAMTARGVVARIVSDGELTIVVPASGETKRVPDRDAVTSLHLATWDNAVVGIRDGSVWRVSLK